MTRKRFHLLFVVLTLLSVAVVNQSCVTSMIVSSLVKDHKKNSKQNKLMKEAIGPLDLGEYKIDNVTEKVTLGEMTSFLQSKNCVAVDSKEDYQGKIDYIKFVPQQDLYKYYYKLKNGKDFSNAKLGKCCVLAEAEYWMTHEVYYEPSVCEVYWSGEVVNGYINGKGSGINLNNLKIYESGRAEGYFYYFEGEYVSGIPVTDINAYCIEMGKVGNISEISPEIIPKQDAKFFLEKNRDKLDQAMLDNFVAGNTDFQYEKVRNLIADYKKYAEDIILNEKTPQLSQGIYGRDIVGVMRLVIRNSPEDYNKRHTLVAFKNSEGIDKNKIKELLSLDNKPLLESIDETLKYMDLLDGLALTSGKYAERAIAEYDFSYIRQFGAPNIERSNYYSVIDNAINIAKELEKNSTGTLREKYAVAGQKISNWKNSIIDVKNYVYSEVNSREKRRKESEEKRRSSGQHELDSYNTTDPSGKIITMSGIFSSYKTYEKDGRIYTKGGDYCKYNVIYDTDGKLNHYTINYSTKKNIVKRDFESLAELIEYFLSK